MKNVRLLAETLRASITSASPLFLGDHMGKSRLAETKANIHNLFSRGPYGEKWASGSEDLGLAEAKTLISPLYPGNHEVTGSCFAGSVVLSWIETESYV